MDTSHETKLMMAIVQAQDADIAENALKAINIDSYQMPSVGGFLGRKNVTLIIDVPDGRSEEIIDILKSSCCQRIEFITVPIESAQQAIPTPTQIAVGGAAVFSLTAKKVIKF